MKDTSNDVFYNISERDAIRILLNDRWIFADDYTINKLIRGGHYELDKNCFLIWLKHSQSLVELSRQELLLRLANNSFAQ